MSAGPDPLLPLSPPAGRAALGLTERERLVVELKAGGRSWQGVAEELGVSRSTVRSAWLSARRKIRLAREGTA